MDIYCHNMVRRLIATLPKRSYVVEFGSLNVNGTVRDLFVGIHYTGIDLKRGRCVDVVADAATYTPEEPPDTVLCLSVLEHSPKGEEIIRNAHRILAPGGILIVCVPTEAFGAHGADGCPCRRGEFYLAGSERRLSQWAAAFTILYMVEDHNLLFMMARKEHHGRKTPR